MNGFMTNWQDRSDFMEQEFVKALPILHHLMKAGHQAYFVGGAVRDSYMKRKIGDVTSRPALRRMRWSASLSGPSM